CRRGHDHGVCAGRSTEAGAPDRVVPASPAAACKTAILTLWRRRMTDSRSTAVPDSPECWPALPLSAWKDTRDTLHMWTQIVGKTRLTLTPLINHWWNVPLYVSSRGLTTTAISYYSRAFDVECDSLDTH